MKLEHISKIKQLFEIKSHRMLNDNELANIQNDPAYLIDVLFDEIEDMQKRISILENKK